MAAVTGALHPLGLDGLRLALLLLGHVLADFALQNDAMVRRKREPRVLARHGARVLLAAVLTYLPLLTLPSLVVLAALALAHVAIDRGKVAFETRHDRPLAAFLGDQALHLSTLVLAWAALAHPALAAPFLLSGTGAALSSVSAELTTAAVVLAGLLSVGKGGTALVRGLLARYPSIPAAVGEEEYAMGRTIGTLERTIAFVLVLLGQWGALGLLLAAKSIARFKDLDQRPFAEYYLIGTFASLLVAVLMGVAVDWLV